MTPEALAQAFDNATLATSAWNHRAHVTVAMTAIRRLGEAEALPWMRDGIRRLNAAHGLVETPSRGYHETLTRFWVWRVARAIEAADPSLGDEQLADAVWQACSERNLALEWWSPGRLWSPEARAGWCAPDLKPLETA